MPLKDHFHPPLSVRRHWHSFHNAWATFIASALNAQLPEGFFAEANVQFGIEIDVAAFEEMGNAGLGHSEGKFWRPTAPVMTIPFLLVTDVVEVLVYGSEEGPLLAGAIEMVSPANKDRPEHRETFVSKCETYLHQGVGVVIIDVVTSRHANLHAELLKRLDKAVPSDADLYATAYHPVNNGQTSLDIWFEPLTVDAFLPVMPLWLKRAEVLPIELEVTYERTCQELRISV